MNSRFEKKVLLAIDLDTLTANRYFKTEVIHPSFWQSMLRMLNETVTDNGYEFHFAILATRKTFDTSCESALKHFHRDLFRHLPNSLTSQVLSQSFSINIQGATFWKSLNSKIFSNDPEQHHSNFYIDANRPKARIITEIARREHILLNYCIYLGDKQNQISQCKAYRINCIDTSNLMNSNSDAPINHQLEKITQHLIAVTRELFCQPHPNEQEQIKQLKNREVKIEDAPFYVVDKTSKWFRAGIEFYIVDTHFSQNEFKHYKNTDKAQINELLMQKLPDENLLIMESFENAKLYAKSISMDQAQPIILKVNLIDLSLISKLLYCKFKVFFDRPKPNDVLDIKSLAVRSSKNNLNIISTFIPQKNVNDEMLYQEIFLAKNNINSPTI